jgi:6-phosphogluconolactonase
VSHARPAPRFHAYAEAEDWAHGACGDIAGLLADALAMQPLARLLLSGGTTPAPVYRALAREQLDWARVQVALVDERWLPPGDADSNGRLVADALLQDAARAARFEPMLQAGQSLADAVRAADAAARAGAPGAIAVLGMGPDGHTASLFPGMRDFDAALAADDDVLAVDARGCPVADAWHERLTLSPRALARAAQRVLLLRGDAKRALFERALAGDDARELPVRLALEGSTPLRVHWCP